MKYGIMKLSAALRLYLEHRFAINTFFDYSARVLSITSNR